MRLTAYLPLILVCFAFLSGCSAFNEQEKPPLPGERISVLELQKSLTPDSDDGGAQIELPDVWENEFWPQSGGYPNHSMQHLNLNWDGKQLKQIWSADIGAGTTDELPLTAQPIVVDGRIYTLDTRSRVSAFDIQTGEKIWQRAVDDPKEDDPVIGGGLGFSNSTIYVTTGYDEIVALDPKKGKIRWRKDMPAAIRAAPTIMENRIFVMTLDNRLLALDSNTGDLIWEHIGFAESAGVLGAASPAANRDIVVPAFSSGEITALRIENGSVAWSDNLSNVRRAGGLESLADIKALPVIDKGLVIAVSFNGRMVAIDERTGTRIWQREIGSLQTPWVIGNTIFVVTSENQIVSLNRDNGQIFWVKDLPRFTDPEDRKGKIFWNGPILAGQTLWTVGTNRELLGLDPFSGDVITRVEMRDKVALPPLVAGGHIYILSENGTLSAWQ